MSELSSTRLLLGSRGTNLIKKHLEMMSREPTPADAKKKNSIACVSIQIDNKKEGGAENQIENDNIVSSIKSEKEYSDEEKNSKSLPRLKKFISKYGTKRVNRKQNDQYNRYKTKKSIQYMKSLDRLKDQNHQKHGKLINQKL